MAILKRQVIRFFQRTIQKTSKGDSGTLTLRLNPIEPKWR